jgi:hypothetical protein
MQKYLKIGYYLQEIKITINMKIILSFSYFAFFQDIHKTTTQNQQKTPTDYFIFNIVITIILTSMMQI